MGFPKTLTLRLAVWVLLAALPSLLVGAGLFAAVVRDLVETRERAADTLARQAIKSLDRVLYERDRDTAVFAGLPVVRALDPERLPEVADQLVVGYAPYYALAFAVDRTGRILGVNRVDAAGSSIPTDRLIGRSVAGQPWFEKALKAAEAVVMEDVHDDPLVEAVLPGRHRVLSFSAAIRGKDGQVVGMWSTRVPLASLESVLARVEDAEAAALFPLLVRSAGGDVVLRVGPWPDATSDGLARRAVSASTGVADWRGVGWQVEVYQPPGSIGWPTVLVGLAVWVALLVLGGGVGLGVIVHRRLVRPLLALKALAERRAQAARTVPVERVVLPVERTPVETPVGDDEVGELTRAVRTMVREIDGHLARLTRLNTVTSVLQRDVLSMPALLTRIAEAARELTGARYAALGVFDETGEGFDQLFTAGVDEAIRTAIGRLPAGRGLLGHLAKEDGVLRLADLTQHPAFTGFPPHHPPLTSFMGISLRAHGQLFGRLYVADKTGEAGRPEPFTELDEQLFEALARLAASAVESAALVRELKAAESRLRSILNAVDEGVFGVDRVGICVFANRAGAARLGYAADELIGQALHPLVHPKRADGRPCAEAVCPFFEGGRTARAHQCEAEILWRRDGTSMPVAGSSWPWYGEDGAVRGVVITFTDLTDRERLEAQLRQAQKLEALGRLAGGIAHDFNNILTAILGYSTVLLEQIAPTQRRYVEHIREAGERAAALTRQILAFSRKEVIAPRVLDLNAVVSEMEEFVHRLIGEDIALRVIGGSALGRIKADRHQLEQVIMNLAVNAKDAMPDGGVLTIETANAELDEAYCRTHPDTKPGRYVMLAVSDNGHGMDAVTLARCLEPFFTTKPVGKGTGLGLSTVYGIVKQSGGTLSIYSEPGRGTTVKLYLPRVDEEPVEPADAGRRTSPAKPCTETVLVVEDDDAVREYARTVLGACGYTVLAAATGEEALAVSAGHRGWIHLLLTDVVLSDMNGRRLAERLQAERPELKALFMSGYAENAIVHHGVLDPTVAFLRKPFSAEGLRAAVREALDS